MTDWARTYARQDYLTPGAAETVDMFARRARPDETMRVLDVAPGKGEAAISLAERFGCQAIGLDAYAEFVELARTRSRARAADGLVSFVRGDGQRLPFRAGAFDGAMCIGGPSIVGAEGCLGELARVVRPRGVVVVSDLVWRVGNHVVLGPEYGWLAEYDYRVSVDDWAVLMAACGLALEETVILGLDAWDAYHDPMLEVAAEARKAGDHAFADEVVKSVLPERLAAEQGVFEYAVFVMSRPDR